MSEKWPIRVFVDTSVVERANFHFQGPLLSSLESQGKKGNIILLLPEVTLKEWRNRIKVRVDDAKELVSKTHAKTRILRSCRDDVTQILFPDVDWTRVHSDFLGQLDAFTRQHWVKRLKTPAGAAERAVDSFYQQSPPFGKGKKRFEFVDAIALDTLREYAETDRTQIAVVSLDDDLRRYCECFKPFTCSDSLESTLGGAVEEAEEILNSVVSRLNSEWKRLDEWAEELVAEVEFCFNIPGGDLDVLEIKCVQCDDLQVVEAEGSDITLGLDVLVSAEAGVSVGHPLDPQAYQEWIRADATIPATLSISLDSKIGRVLENAEFELLAGTTVDLERFEP